MITDLEKALLGIMMLFIMFGMGSGLTWRDFFESVKKPQSVLAGMLCQFGLMPLIAYTLGLWLGLSTETRIGLLIMGCIPAGTTSNIFAYFAKANVALSIIMTVSSTLLAIFLTPTLLLFYGSKIVQTELEIPFAEISKTLFLLIVPVALGMFLRKIHVRAAQVAEKVGSFLGVLVIIFLIVSWIPRNVGLLATTTANIYFASIGLGVIGFTLGFLFAKLLRQPQKNALSISFETGIQNSPMGIAIILFTFPKEVQDAILIVPALYALFIIITSSLFVILLRTWVYPLNSKNTTISSQ